MQRSWPGTGIKSRCSRTEAHHCQGIAGLERSYHQPHHAELVHRKAAGACFAFDCRQSCPAIIDESSWLGSYNIAGMLSDLNSKAI